MPFRPPVALTLLFACQVGEHFSRFGRVMDVVLVKDFGTLLSLAAQATSLEKQRARAGEMLGRHFARAWQQAGAASPSCRGVEHVAMQALQDPHSMTGSEIQP